MSTDQSAIDDLAEAVLAKLKRGGLLSSRTGEFGTLANTNAVASAIAAKLAHEMSPSARPQGRTVSDGMLRLASAVSYKLGKATDPKTASFNKVASEVAKKLYEARSGKERSSGGQAVGVHSSVSAGEGATDG